MKVIHDAEVDVLQIGLSDTAIEESDAEKPGTILDAAAAGNMIGIEILEVSKRIPNPRSFEHLVMK